MDGLLLATALLGLGWNLEAFINFGLRDFGVSAPHPYAQAAAFSALGLLPSVAVHSVVRSGISARRGTRVVIAAAYGLGLAAAALHVHPNTVSQRLDRVAGLLGAGWRNPARALDLQLALRVHRLQR